MKRTLTWLALSITAAVIVFLGTNLNAKVRIEIGAAAGLVSFIMMLIGRRQLGKSFAVMPKAKSLVTGGLYSKFLHPMYLFLDIFLASVIFILNMPWLLLPWAAIVTLQAVQSGKEEKVLADAFGQEYEDYRQETWL